MKTLVREILWWIRRIPVTLLVLATAIVFGISTKALWVSAESTGMVERYGWSLPAFRGGDFLSVFGGAFVAPAPWMYILILVPILVQDF